MMAATKGVLTRVIAVGAGALSIAVAGGCAVDGTNGAPTETRASEGAQALTVNLCQPLTCCFPSGGGWSDNPFENGLRALGCTEPQAYTESFGQSKWWKYSMCPTSLDLTALTLKYALVSPYYSEVAVNECLELQAVLGGQPTSAFIAWDPTCSTCYYRFQSYSFYVDPAVAAQQQQQTATQ
jgi:hypothetical protein